MKQHRLFGLVVVALLYFTALVSAQNKSNAQDWLNGKWSRNIVVPSLDVAMVEELLLQALTAENHVRILHNASSGVSR